MPPASRPQWQQATALITIGAGSVATGLSLVPKAAADLTTPASIPPVTLLALEHANAPAPGRDAMLRAAIVHMARHFLRLAQTRSPAEMEAMIWQHASTDGANHGPSCGAFASLTLELGSHIAGVDSWVTGGASYPWPVHSWVDGRVDPNAASPGVVSILQDARSHGRWHALGDGYAPQPGDWVLFDGHVEVVTKYHGGVLHTIGGDSLPNLSVNAHEYAGPLQDQGVAGFVDNGIGMSKAPGGAAHKGGGGHRARAAASPGSPAAAPMASADPTPPGGAAASANPAPGAVSSGGVSPDAAPNGAAPSAGPVTTADAPARQPVLAPRAIPAPRTVPRSRYAQESRALAEQGARPAAAGHDASGTGAAPRTARAVRTPAEQQGPHGNGAGAQASRAGRAARPAGGRSQPSGQGSHHADQRSHTDQRSHADQRPQRADRGGAMTADVPATGLRPARPHHARPGEAAIPGLFKGAHRHHAAERGALAPYHRHDVPPSDAPLPGTATQQAFIKEVAAGAMDTQRRYGVPASVTIAQAIDESGWGQSLLATSDHNLFGIKGTGPAGTDEQPTQEVINGQLVNLSASFQIYQSIAQSIDAHGRLLARSGDYAGAMSRSKDPNAFAAALTGIYATDPSYGAKLIQLMKQYDLYRFDQAASRGDASGASGSAPAAHHPAHAGRGSGTAEPGGQRRPARNPKAPSPGPGRRAGGHDHTSAPPQPGPIGNPVPVQPAPIAEPGPGQPAAIANPVPGQPRPIARPPSRAHEANPARGTQTGAGTPAHQAAPPHQGQADGHLRVVPHDAVTPPAATLYPGRSSRPAPLAHPARPTDLGRPAGAAPSHGSGASSSPAQAQQPGLWPDPAPGPSRTTAGSGNGRPGGHASPGSPAGEQPAAEAGPDTAPASGGRSGQAHTSADAAIPGVPHVVMPPARHAHARRPVSRLRPAHPARRLAPAQARPQHAGPAAPANAPGGSAATQQEAAPDVRPAIPGPGPAQTPQVIIPVTTAPAGNQAGSAVIPGLQHHGLAARVAAGQSGGAAKAPVSGATAMAEPGGSSIPGAQPAAMTGSQSSPARPGTPAATQGHSPTARREPAPGGRNAPAAPEGQASPVRPRPGHSPASPGTPAGPAQPATAPSRPAARSAGPVARGRQAARPSQSAARGGAAQPSTGHEPGAPVPASAAPGKAASNRVPAPASPVPVTASPAPAAANPVPAAASTPAQGGADVPGLAHAAQRPAAGAPARTTARVKGGGPAASGTAPSRSSRVPGQAPGSSPAPRGSAGATLTVYHAHMPPSVREAFVTSAKAPLVRAEPLYRDVASHTGIRWEILAACDWMQCKARHGHSPVYGEKLGTVNPDDTCYRTKSAALEQCASDLVQLARSVYQLDITTSRAMTVRDLANVFAAFRWGGLLRQHCTSAMDFPYSVAGLTADHTHMRWPDIDEPNAPDKPGSRFRQPFGAVPVVLGLNYQALM